MQASRALLALVIVMGVLIVLGTTGLVVVVVHRLTHPATAVGGRPTAAAVPMSPLEPERPLPDREALGEPAGTRIVAVSRQADDVLAISLAGGGPDRVLIWNYRRALRLTELALEPPTH